MGQATANEFANETSLHTAGSVASPTAGTVICTMTPPRGTYRVDVRRAADGSGTPLLYNNAVFRVGSTDYTLLAVPELGLVYNYTFNANVDGAQVLAIVAPGNTSANITITASITATRIA